MRLTLILLTALSLFAAGSDYHKVASWKVPDDGAWNYLTAEADFSRLYVSLATEVVVFNTKTGEKVGIIPDTRASTE